jgi:hypothetical protein
MDGQSTSAPLARARKGVPETSTKRIHDVSRKTAVLALMRLVDLSGTQRARQAARRWIAGGPGPERRDREVGGGAEQAGRETTTGAKWWWASS